MKGKTGLVGKCGFEQNQTLIYCDSAKRNKKENCWSVLASRSPMAIHDNHCALSLGDGNKTHCKTSQKEFSINWNTATCTLILDFDGETILANFNGGKVGLDQHTYQPEDYYDNA